MSTHNSDNITDADILINKYNNDGQLIWSDRFDSGARDSSYFGVDVDGAGDIFVSAYLWYGSNADVWVRKYDPNGVTVWTDVYDGGGTDMDMDLAVHSQGSAVVVGYTVIDSEQRIWMRKYPN